jgi:seryl-tRNA synthetase
MDLAAARNDPAPVRAALARKGAGELFDELMDVDARTREAQQRVETLRAARRIKGRPTDEQREELARTKARLEAAEAEYEPLKQQRDSLLARLPNSPEEEAPSGGEDDFAVLREVGERPAFDFEPRDHLELAAERGWIDLERGAKVSGSRFVYRVGDLALTELALYRWALDRLVQKGFTPVLPPVLVREDAMVGTGFLPTDEVNIYRLERDDLYLTGTSEVALAGFHGGETLDESDLPLRYAGFSTNFRREAGAAGKDTRGMFRVHQFDKVEMFVLARPEDAQGVHRDLLAIEEELVDELGLAYRVVDIAAGDLGASAARKFDIEAWFPGQGRYREVTSTSNTTDFQADRRRLDIGFRREGGKREPVHTLNGTAVTARALLAVMETFQDEDGSIAVPECLLEFGAPGRLGGDRTGVA